MPLPIHRDLKAAAKGPFRRFAALFAAIVGLGLATGGLIGGLVWLLVQIWQDEPAAVWLLAAAALAVWGVWGLYAWLRRPDVNGTKITINTGTANTTTNVLNYDPSYATKTANTVASALTNAMVPVAAEKPASDEFSVTVKGVIPEGFHAKVERPAAPRAATPVGKPKTRSTVRR